MKKEIFAKIFETEKYQILITKDSDEDDNSFLLCQTVWHNGVGVSISPGFKKESKRNDLFNKYDQKMAEDFIDSLKDLLPC